jgi:hypothetical protein
MGWANFWAIFSQTHLVALLANKRVQLERYSTVMPTFAYEIARTMT